MLLWSLYSMYEYHMYENYMYDFLCMNIICIDIILCIYNFYNLIVCLYTQICMNRLDSHVALSAGERPGRFDIASNQNYKIRSWDFLPLTSFSSHFKMLWLLISIPRCSKSGIFTYMWCICGDSASWMACACDSFGGGGFGGVLWGVITFMSKCTPTQCYATDIYRCFCLHWHSHFMLRYRCLCLHWHTHFMLRCRCLCLRWDTRYMPRYRCLCAHLRMHFILRCRCLCFLILRSENFMYLGRPSWCYALTTSCLLEDLLDATLLKLHVSWKTFLMLHF